MLKEDLIKPKNDNYKLQLMIVSPSNKKNPLYFKIKNSNKEKHQTINIKT